MIFIQSQNFDLSTNTVIEWLLHLKAPFIRANKEDHGITLRHFSFQDGKAKIVLSVNGKDIDLDDVGSYWHRRGPGLLHSAPGARQTVKKSFSRVAAPEVVRNLNSQIQTLNEFVHKQLLAAAATLGNPNRVYTNKIVMLQTAIALGIDVPATIVTTRKEELLAFLQKEKNIISKGIQESLFIPGENEHIVQYTEQVTEELVSELPDSFAPSLFQKMVDKKIELRIFYLKGRCYSMAIFSQNDDQTKVDFRKYNDEAPNRTVPYLLPEDIQSRLTALMTVLDMDTGSIDMIVTAEKKYYFLEINPVGQFGMVSYPCNYLLEREIAYYLTGKKQSHDQIRQ
jgi:ATP-GRASP peptide maturase of grasp-with-spasm system